MSNTVHRVCILLCFAASGLSSADNAGMQPFALDHRKGAGSAIDLSFLLTAPAGKSGFVRTEGGHLVTPDGKRLRLWGVNVTDWSKGSTMLPPKEDAPMWAATLARYGVNCVRLHFLDLAAPRGLIDATKEDTRSFDAQQLDRLDFWIAELKKRGIYIDLNLNVGRSYKPGDGVQDSDKIRWGKGLTFYDARLIELQKEYAKQLLSHTNPYTKTAYSKETAIAIVEICNENALYVGFRAPTPAYDKELSGHLQRVAEAEAQRRANSPACGRSREWRPISPSRGSRRAKRRGPAGEAGYRASVLHRNGEQLLQRHEGVPPWRAGRAGADYRHGGPQP